MTTAVESSAPATPVQVRVSGKPPDHLPVRVAALVVLLLLAHAWSFAHLGVDLSKVLYFEAAGAGFAALVTLLRKRDRGAFTLAARQSLFFALRTPALVGGYLLLFVVAAAVGSITVSAGGVDAVGNATLVSVDGKSTGVAHLEKGADEQRFVRFTTPFGRRFVLQVPNYQRHPVTLYPLIPVQIRVPVEMKVAPSLLLRVPPRLKVRFPGLEIQVLPKGKVIGRVAPPHGVLAVIVGPGRRIPETIVPAWDRQIVRAKHTIEQAATIDAWMTPVKLETTAEIDIGMKVKAQVVEGSPGGEVVASNEFTVTSEALQDVLLLPLVEPGTTLEAATPVLPTAEPSESAAPPKA